MRASWLPETPTVAFTAPLPGTVAGTVQVQATATDNVGVLGVQYKLDGVALGSEVATAPYTLAWDTTMVADGPHTLTAEARDVGQQHRHGLGGGDRSQRSAFDARVLR